MVKVPHFILARHKSGRFDDIQVFDVRERVATWQQNQQDVIHKFVSLLRKISATAKERSDGKLELDRQPDSSILEVREQYEGVSQALSDELLARWSGTLSSHLDSDGDTPELSVTGGAKLLNNDEYSDEDESEKDFTACSAEDCGYCGHCKY